MSATGVTDLAVAMDASGHILASGSRKQRVNNVAMAIDTRTLGDHAVTILDLNRVVKTAKSESY